MVTVDSELVAGRYKLIREVGRGGMGFVWLAHDEVLGRDVALKRLGQFPGAQNQARVQREAQLAARLSHPNVVTVFDLAEDGDTRWLVMEYVAGTTLSRLAADRGGLPPEEAAAIIRQAAEALRVAHAAGITHRDVKPSNLIVMPDGTTKLTDFGIARGASDDTLTATGMLTGSPAYLAPEVASGRFATSASDMWSLGATLFQALSGRPPYDLGDNLVAGLVKIVHEEPPRLPLGSGPLGTVLAATMVKDPERRWTAAQVSAFLDAAPTTTVRHETMRLPAVPPPPPPTSARIAARTVAPAPTAALTPAPAPAPAPASPPVRRHAGLLWPSVAAALVVVLLVGAWLLGRSGSATPHRVGGAAGSSTTSSSPSSPQAGSTAPSTPPAASSGPTAAGMASFITDYLDTVTRDPRSAFTMLTPAFQRASGGWSQYHAWWAPIRSATVSDVRADPSSMTVRYHVAYDDPRHRLSSDDVELRLVYSDGHYRIDGEPR
ncbi:serine/threonine-protein kinase [Nocardioides sp. AN3]